MARMVAQRNSRAFQSTLLNREHVLDKHILSLLEKFNDPTFFKKKHGYNVHGQMLGKDGKMIIKVRVKKCFYMTWSLMLFDWRRFLSWAILFSQATLQNC